MHTVAVKVFNMDLGSDSVEQEVAILKVSRLVLMDQQVSMGFFNLRNCNAAPGTCPGRSHWWICLRCTMIEILLFESLGMKGQLFCCRAVEIGTSCSSWGRWWVRRRRCSSLSSWSKATCGKH